MVRDGYRGGGGVAEEEWCSEALLVVGGANSWLGEEMWGRRRGVVVLC